MKNILETLNKKGYLVCNDFFARSQIEKVLNELKSQFLSEKTISVNSDGINIKTLNGKYLISKCPTVFEMYQAVYLTLKSEIKQLHELKEIEIGISSNFLKKTDDGFRLHFDRNALTCVVYLNDCKKFPLHFYPNVRANKNETFNLADHELISVYPKDNRCILFYGNRTFHGVFNDKIFNSDGRFSLQFAFDFKKRNYEDEEYYGKI